MATLFSKYCNVVWVGSNITGTNTPPLEVNIWLTATDGTFTNTQFYFPAVAQNQMLAVAIAAMTTGKTVSASGTLPNTPNTPLMEITQLYLVS